MMTETMISDSGFELITHGAQSGVLWKSFQCFLTHDQGFLSAIQLIERGGNQNLAHVLVHGAAVENLQDHLVLDTDVESVDGLLPFAFMKSRSAESEG